MAFVELRVSIRRTTCPYRTHLYNFTPQRTSAVQDVNPTAEILWFPFVVSSHLASQGLIVDRSSSI